ncbi:TetR/AcrR family transcriptional regulator [Paenibacillus sp. NPDC058071]|uniref:TetR/AcrR family transcriptional regulator n=1 Tax=Paenibacillus sp. NPDC058071 TaxID=3346326 RepID=UPI0036D7D0D7
MSNVFQPNPNHPSVILTRQNILNAFSLQLHKMDFNSITVLDITRVANINRSTFYAHFQDKIAVLEAFLANAFLEYVLNRVENEGPLTEETIRQLIFSLCDYHVASNNCIKKYDTLVLNIERDIRLQLEQFISPLLSKSNHQANPKTLETAVKIVSLSIYEITYQWNLEGRLESPAELADRVMPLLMLGIKSL